VCVLVTFSTSCAQLEDIVRTADLPSRPLQANAFTQAEDSGLRPTDANSNTRPENEDPFVTEEDSISLAVSLPAVLEEIATRCSVDIENANTEAQQALKAERLASYLEKLSLSDEELDGTALAVPVEVLSDEDDIANTHGDADKDEELIRDGHRVTF
jgi:hypothetical protein